MSEIASNYITSRLPITGVAAYTIQVADQPLEVECLSKSIYPSSTREMLSRLIQGSRTLLPSGKSPVQYCWTFENHRIYVAGRPDGICLALLVENNPNTQLLRVKETLQGFLDLEEV